MSEIASYDNGLAWPIRASEVFTEDALLCGASLVGGGMCIRRLDDGLCCKKHGQRRIPPTAREAE